MRTARLAGKWGPGDAAKSKARSITKQYVKSSVLKKYPCRDCGALKVEAHHEDYSKPLEIIWLCKRCHARLHLKQKELAWLEKLELLRADPNW